MMPAKSMSSLPIPGRLNHRSWVRSDRQSSMIGSNNLCRSRALEQNDAHPGMSENLVYLPNSTQYVTRLLQDTASICFEHSSCMRSTLAYSPGAPLSALPGLLGTQSNAFSRTAVCGSVASARVMGWTLPHSAHPDIWRDMSRIGTHCCSECE